MDRHVGNYALGPLLARGGSGDVYAGNHRFLGDAVAIKLMRLAPGGAAEDAAALVAEATRTRAIAHANVVRVLDVGVDPATACCYLVMERVDGEDLAARLARQGPVDEAAARRLGAAIADGLAAAHARGIVHRDVKPANVMLGGDTPKLVDFGIAKVLGDRSAATTQRRVGTPAYMAPEQLVGGVITPAVDVWALGVILFELVAGRTPFLGYEDGRCPQLVEVAPRVATVVPVSAAYDALVARCLTVDPGSRPASAAAVAAALRETGDAGVRHTVDLDAVATAASGAPPAATTAPPAATERRRWRRVAAALGAVAALAGIAIAAVGFARTRGATGRTAPDAPGAPIAAPVPADAAPPPDARSAPPDARVRPDARARPDAAPRHPRGGDRAHDRPPAARPDAREGLD